MADDSSSLSDFKLYHYDPSLPAAIVFIVVFSILAVAQSFTLIRNRLWFFIPFTIGVIRKQFNPVNHGQVTYNTTVEVIGYIGRAINASQSPDWTLGPYIMQSLCLLLPPIFFAASIYMTLGRLVRAVNGEKCCPIRVAWITKAFVIGDVFSFLIQSSGGGLLSKGGDSVDLGSNLILGGLILQILYFGLFIIIAGIFHYRFQRHGDSSFQSVPWRKYLVVLYATSLLIFVRCLYRTVEYGQGFDGYLLNHEVYLYIFDALLMTLVVALYVAFPQKELCQSKRISQQSALPLNARSRVAKA